MANLKALAATLTMSLAATVVLFITPVTEAANPVKEWTMLVFINGHNNLDMFGAMDINEMEQIGSTEQVNVVVQWASTGYPKTRRLLVEKDNDRKKVTSPIVQELPRVDMGDFRNLVDFVRWGHENYPARHYFVAVWNHGTGWHKLQLTGGFSTWDISTDDYSGNAITTLQLGEAMEEIAKIIGRKVDIYGSDACLMGMVEVAHQMKDSVEYFIGSEDLEPGQGWPYEMLLERWNKIPNATGADVAKILPEVFAASYTNGSQGNDDVTLSSFDLKYIDALTTGLSNLRVRLAAETQAPVAMKAALARTLKFAFNDYVDLGNFLLNLKSTLPTVGKSTFLTDLEDALKNLVIANKATGRFKRAQGIAIWLPRTTWDYNKHQKAYRDLSFDINSQWHQLIESSL